MTHDKAKIISACMQVDSDGDLIENIIACVHHYENVAIHSSMDCFETMSAWTQSDIRYDVYGLTVRTAKILWCYHGLMRDA